jgi:hypothetical protein
LGNKSNNLIILFNKKIKIPDTYIVWNDFFWNIKIDFLDKDKNYILRPSFQIEDSQKSSFAWFFKSIFPIKKEEIIKILNSKDINSYFNWDSFELKSIIIQEYIETDIYWVYFTRNPNNIFKRWFYEIWESNDWVTSGKVINNKKLSFIESKELELIWNKLEKVFNSPQDIEFCIKDEEVWLLQTRPITTWNHTVYSFQEIIKINGIYKYLDFDELWEKQDYFSYEIFKRLFNSLLIDWKIYIKNFLFPVFLLNNIKIENDDLNLFYKNYKRYLISKILYLIIKLISFKKLDKNILKEFFKNYKYSFLNDVKSNLDLKFDYETNFITWLFLKVEKKKNISFYYLEKYKKVYKKDNGFIIDYQYKLNNILIFNKWIIINSRNDDNYIYRWIIQWKISDYKNLNKKEKNQVLICENLDFNIYDKLEYISWLIVKKWNKLSHNSIILREYKIPSIINYWNYENLRVWENIFIDI